MAIHSEHVFTATQLDMSALPTQVAETSGNGGTHVSGFAFMGSLTRLPIERWGEEWIERGELAIRNRGRVRSGQDIAVALSHSERSFDFVAKGPRGVVADGWAAMPVPSKGRPDVVTIDALAARSEPIGAVRAGIEGESLGVLTVGFEADRDLRMVDHLAADDPWRGRTIAHPCYLVWVANALIKDAFGFLLGEWIHAGSIVRNFAPIDDGSEVRFIGTVGADPVRPRDHDITSLDIIVLADGVLANTLEVTIATAGSGPLRYRE